MYRDRFKIKFLVSIPPLTGKKINTVKLILSVRPRPFKGPMLPLTHAQANENKLEKVGPTFSSSVGDFGRLFLSV